MNPSCFICGTRITKKTKILTGNIQKLLQLFCKLESVTDVDPDEWKYFNELNLSNCCSKCYDVLENMERVHDILVETERQLKTYLTQVEKLIVRSESRQNIQNALWMNSNCFKIRRSILKKLACNSDKFLQAHVKEELETIKTSDDPLALGDHFNPVIVGTGSLFERKHNGIDISNPVVVTPNDDDFSETFHDDFHNENESESDNENDNELVQTVNKDDSILKTSKGLKNSNSKCFTEIKYPSRVRLKRKIIVISEEDDIPDKVTFRETSCRAAKLIAEKALQQCTPKDDDDDKLNIENSRVSESEASCIEDNEPDTEAELKPLRRNRTTKKKLLKRPVASNGRLIFLPMVYADENLYLVRWGTFVQRTYTHLQCKAYNCTYQVEFDYYDSYQKIKDHILVEHRDRRHRQRTLHPCLLCKTLCKNQEDFRKHIKVHEQLSNLHKTKAICECCSMITLASHARTHAFNHKNDEEKAAARAANDGNARCFRLKESQMTTKIYVCDFENCNKSFKGGSNLRRHKRTHLPMEERTDFTICPECGVRILKETLPTHMQRIHHPETVYRVLLCPICDKRYLPADRAMLLRHIRVHKGEKPHLCQECGVHCTDLAYHMRNYHTEKPDPLPCQFCDLVYNTKKSLQMHLRRSHRDKYTPKPSFKSMSKFYSGNEPEEKAGFIGPIQRFPCQICEVICKYRFTLRRHMSRKHGEKDIRRRRRKPYSIKETVEPEEEDFSNLTNDEEEMDTSELMMVPSAKKQRTEIFQGSSSASGYSSIPNPNLPKYEN